MPPVPRRGVASWFLILQLFLHIRLGEQAARPSSVVIVEGLPRAHEIVSPFLASGAIARPRLDGRGPHELLGRPDPLSLPAFNKRDGTLLLRWVKLAQRVEVRTAIGDRRQCSHPGTDLGVDPLGPGN